MTATEAKEFVISRIVAEATQQGVSLTDTEKEMLWWTEVHPESHISDLKRLAERFDAECGSDEYEQKIQGLVAAVQERDSGGSSAQAQRWKQAMKVLGTEDHYINVILSSASSAQERDPHRTRDVVLYLAIAGLIVLGVVIYTILIHPI